MEYEIIYLEPRSNYKLYVEFDNGETRLFDVQPYTKKGIFLELQNPEYFRKVRIIWGGVGWPNEQDLSADTLLLRGEKVPKLRQIAAET